MEALPVLIPVGPAEEPKDPQKNKCYYDERVAKLEAIIVKLLKIMPELGKPDWIYLIIKREKKNGNIRECKNECRGNVSNVDINSSDLICIRNSNLNRKIKNRLNSRIEWNPFG